MNIPLPDTLKAFVETRAAELGYDTASEHVRELIRREHERHVLRSALLEGAASPAVVAADLPYFEGLRERARSASASR